MIETGKWSSTRPTAPARPRVRVVAITRAPSTAASTRGASSGTSSSRWRSTTVSAAGEAAGQPGHPCGGVVVRGERVEHDERVATSSTAHPAAVQVACDEQLAGARLPAHQQRPVGAHRGVDVVAQSSAGDAAPDEPSRPAALCHPGGRRIARAGGRISTSTPAVAPRSPTRVAFAWTTMSCASRTSLVYSSRAPSMRQAHSHSIARSERSSSTDAAVFAMTTSSFNDTTAVVARRRARRKCSSSSCSRRDASAYIRDSISRTAARTSGLSRSCRSSTPHVTSRTPSTAPLIGCRTGAPMHVNTCRFSRKCSAPDTTNGLRSSSALPMPLVPVNSSA